jgi:hypothetical protein
MSKNLTEVEAEDAESAPDLEQAGRDQIARLIEAYQLWIGYSQ